MHFSLLSESFYWNEAARYEVKVAIKVLESYSLTLQ